MKGWERRICACFSKSWYSLKKLLLHLGEIREGEKKGGCFRDAVCQPNFLCLGGSLPRFSAFNTGNFKYLHDCFRFTSQSPPYYVNQTAGPYSEHPCQSVSPLRLHDVSEAEDVEPSSGKTILFLLCRDTAVLIPQLAGLADRNFVCNLLGAYVHSNGT